MSLRSLRDTLYSLTGSVVSQDSSVEMDTDSVWVAAGEGVWSDGITNGNGNGLFGWRTLLSTFGFGHSHHGHYHGVTDWRNLFFWLAVFAILVLFAVITNPTESSFRAHLTELSFRRHLADIRRAETDEAVPLTDEQAQLPSTTSSSAHLVASDIRRGSIPGPGSETPTHTIAPFRFANHVAISLRTPTLLYRSFLICSIIITSPLTPPAYLSDPTPPHLTKGKHNAHSIKERYVLWFGCMGHWTLIGLIPTSVEWAWKLLSRGEREKTKKRNLDKAGVIEMRAIQNKEDSAPNVKAAIGHSLTSSKNMRRTDSSSNLADSLPLHSHTAQLTAGPLSPDSRRPSLVNLISQPASAITADAPEIANSPAIIALKAELTAAQIILTDLQTQLTSHERSVSDAHGHLQRNLDDIRNRRKEDDAERQELKSRTKSLEEQKRQAEAARREAEKKLKAVEALRDGLLAKISSSENEIRELKGNIEASERNVRVIQEEGAKHVVLTQLNVEERKKEMEFVESEITEIEDRNDELHSLIKAAEERLKAIIVDGENARKIGPEEEMMMMAAAYEAAAQEGYLHSGYQPNNGHHVPPPPPGPPNGRGAQQEQWQSQAAAYMAEAGMPHLGYDYTAKPAHSGSTGFGHLSKHPNPNSASSRDLEGMRHRPDVSGFEDFGPGTAFAPQRSTTPQMPSDSESDIYGLDPGSPYGGFSSSNLLPQGLFRSLEGDQTPFVSGDEGLPESSEEPLTFDLDRPISHEASQPSATVTKLERQAAAGQEDEASYSASDSGSDHSAEDEEEHEDWKSPLPAPKQLKDTKESAYKRLSANSSATRLLSPSTVPGLGLGQPTSASPVSVSSVNQTNNTSPSTISALPNLLPSSRRWFSGTSSSDNLHSGGFGGFMHNTTSNDSLNLPGYESSPFAPTSSEKKALASAKWQPLGGGLGNKKWSAFGAPLGVGSGAANDEIDANGGWPEPSPPLRPGQLNGVREAEDDKAGEGKKPFRFFSLRGKPTMGSTPP
ncbi:uncharacterized protein I303_107215 [Kwoniella dejecticola CBS 10117]|uniref:Uncharacterized protein n=1 Tax=Kwoniella dejecticola CBS 10117 TaxID=1296121 RepID=A0A1A5ZZ19_9TREE|nr:uncharacterized protein I303_06616 [Kwoniella dejecticola CBS 10117]OBR83057.1 hypothetical protein I303_06616 [Kwoniella dejecticola CBS 10117]